MLVSCFISATKSWPVRHSLSFIVVPVFQKA